jgi:hypothetical protein
MQQGHITKKFLENAGDVARLNIIDSRSRSSEKNPPHLKK